MLDKFGNVVEPYLHRLGPITPSRRSTGPRKFGAPKDDGDPLTLRYLRTLLPGQPLTFPAEQGRAITAKKRRITDLEEPRDDSDAATKVFVHRVTMQTAGDLLRSTLEILAEALTTKSL